MKNRYLMLGFIAAMALLVSGNVAAQVNCNTSNVCGSDGWLNDIASKACNNMEVILLNLDGSRAQNPLQPDTDYRLYFRVTGKICSFPGSGCAGAAAPTSMRIEFFALGCTIDGFSIPPTTNVGRDMGPGKETSDFMTLRTLPAGQFAGQVLFNIAVYGSEDGVCGTNRSDVLYPFDSITDLPTPSL